MQFAANAQAYGVTNIMTACYVTAPNLAGNAQPTSQPIGAAGGQLCSDPDAHLFWDQWAFAHLTLMLFASQLQNPQKAAVVLSIALKCTEIYEIQIFIIFQNA